MKQAPFPRSLVVSALTSLAERAAKENMAPEDFLALALVFQAELVAERDVEGNARWRAVAITVASQLPPSDGAPA